MEPTNYTSGEYKYQGEKTRNTYQFDDDIDTNFELNDLYDNDLTLVKPISIKLDYKEGCFIFTQEDLNLWGEGVTLKDAEKDLVTAIVKLYRKLLSLDKNKLGPYPLEQLTYLEKFISE